MVSFFVGIRAEDCAKKVGMDVGTKWVPGWENFLAISPRTAEIAAMAHYNMVGMEMDSQISGRVKLEKLEN